MTPRRTWSGPVSSCGVGVVVVRVAYKKLGVSLGSFFEDMVFGTFRSLRGGSHQCWPHDVVGLL